MKQTDDAIIILKIISNYTSPLFISSLIVIILPDKYLNLIGLVDFKNNYLQYIGLLCVLTGSLIVINLINFFINKFKSQYDDYTFKKDLIKRLNDLTSEEKEIVNYFITNQTKTQELSILSGVVKGLEINRIIFRATTLGKDVCFEYNIHPIVWEHLNKEKYLVD